MAAILIEHFGSVSIDLLRPVAVHRLWVTVFFCSFCTYLLPQDCFQAHTTWIGFILLIGF